MPYKLYLSAALPQKYKEHVILRHLFVVPAVLDEAIEKTKQKGTLLNTFYNKAKKLKGSDL